MKILALLCEADFTKNEGLDLENEEISLWKSEDEFAENFESLSDGQFHAIVIGASAGKDFLYEALQVCRNQCPTTKIFAFTKDKSAYFPKQARKNGCTDFFLLPQDRSLFREALLESAVTDLNGRVYKKVVSYDLQPDTSLQFDTYLYLPLNKKHVRYSKSNRQIEKRKVEKLEKHGVRDLYIDARDADSFYHYVAEELAKRSNEPNPMGFTEKEAHVAEMTRNIFAEIYAEDSKSSFEKGAEVLGMCQKVIGAVITNGKDSNWLNRLIQNVGGLSSDYSHASEASTYAGLFAMIYGGVKVEEVCIATYLHDVGLVDIPEHENYESPSTMPEELKKAYLEHPERTLNYLKAKKMILTPGVEKAIKNHHERYDGKGFPRGLQGDRIPIEAQIVSLADQFQYQMRIREGEARKNPLDVLKAIFENGSLSPTLKRKILLALDPVEENVEAA